MFLCRYERVLDPELERLEAEFTEVAKQALGLGSIGAGSLPMLSRYFQNHDVGNRFLRWRILAPEPLARLDWRSREAGESRVQLRDPGAGFRAALRGYDPRLHHLRFFVWGDSFEIYLDARSIAEDMGFQVGWKPFEAREQLIFALGGRDYRAPAPVD